MKIKSLINPILYAISLAMGISIIILSYFMDFSCSANIRYLILYLTIAILCLTIAGINSIKK